MRRTTRRSTSFTVVAITALLLACDESPTSPDSQDQASAAPELAAYAANPVVLSASGSGHVVGPVGPITEAGRRTFSFTAQQRQDGTTTGNFEYRTGSGQRQNGRVFCMADLGDGLLAIGAEGTQRVPENQPPNQLGGLGVPDAERPDNHGVFFVVRDNGEGANASAPDQITGAANTTLGFVNGICVLGANHPLVPYVPAFLVDVESGNIQVSP